MLNFLRLNSMRSAWKTVALIIILFTLSVSVRLLYQSESEINNPVRADASEYFFITLNLHNYGVYSHLSPEQVKANPQHNFRRQPGYPLFLYPFMAWSIKSKQTIGDFLNKVSTAQAIMGSLTVVLVFVLSRFFFSPPWALLVALLTSLSPHIIALEQYMLTETVFIFFLVLSCLVIVISFNKRSFALAFLAGLLLGMVFLVRYQGILLGPFLAGTYLLAGLKLDSGDKKRLFGKFILVLVGFSFVVVSFAGIKKSYQSTSKGTALTGEYNLFYAAAYLGTDIDLKNFDYYKADPENNRARVSQDKSYALRVMKDKISSKPLDYLKWYSYGKLLYFWKWDNYYNGDVYQYPMLKKGFEVNWLLRIIHKAMKALHWPLFILSLLSPLIIIRSFIKKRLRLDTFVMIVSISVMLYFYLYILVLFPLPRYGIPLRPISYLLSIYALHQLLSLIKIKCHRTAPSA